MDDEEEPFDSLGYGRRPQMPGGAPPAAPPTRDPPAALRAHSASLPPAGAFSSARGTTTSPGRRGAINSNNTNNAVSLSRTSSTGGDSNLDNDNDEDTEDEADDEDIGREYDNHRIRQEALRMLEVAEASDSNYSVHRTASGGFTAHARQFGGGSPARSGGQRAALTGLNFVARSNNVGKRYADYAVAMAESGGTRDDYEYGDTEGVVDRNGLEQRSAESEGQNKANWSSRYAIDKTVLAMSGGAMRQNNKRSHTDPERLSALNLFNSSPTKNTDVFGSGFSFRQKHVFGKQNVSMDLRNLHSNDGPHVEPTKNAKSWQDQLIQKNRQRRRMLAMFVCALVFVFLVPTFSVYGVRRLHRFPSDGYKGSVTFGVTGNGPYDDSPAFAAQIRKSNEKTRFTVHLGNIQKPEETQCEAAAYEQFAQRLYTSSDDPVFIVPGQKDWNDCPVPETAWAQWEEKFLYFDRKWDATDGDVPEEREFLVFRQREQRENWAFLHEGVLFVGVHVVNGNVPSGDEFKTRNTFNYDWVSGLTLTHQDSLRAVVVFGNAAVGHPANIDFFAPLEEFWRDNTTPALYVHTTELVDNKVSKAYHPFKDLNHFMATSVSSSDAGEPLMINVAFGDAPFRLS
jgi:hypothetical protein